MHSRTVLEESQHDVFLETIDWLKNCEKLHRLSFVGLLSAATVVAPLLIEHKIRIRSLEIDSYTLKDNRSFHQALVHQKDSLTYLSLSGDTDRMFRDDVDILVDSLKQLQKMEVLRLLLQEMFREEHLISIVNSLNKLEELYISGLELTDDLLEPIGQLGNLRSVVLAGISRFTFNGLHTFIDQLGPGNQGIRIMVEMAEPETLMNEIEVSLLQGRLKDKVSGSLEYTPYRGKWECSIHFSDNG